MNDKLEFYHEGMMNPFMRLDSSFTPAEGDLFSIQKITYQVIGRSFSIDHASRPAERSIRCNLILKVYK